MVDLPNTLKDFPNTMVDLPNTMVDLPNTMVDIPNTMEVLSNTMVDLLKRSKKKLFGGVRPVWDEVQIKAAFFLEAPLDVNPSFPKWRQSIFFLICVKILWLA